MRDRTRTRLRRPRTAFGQSYSEWSTPWWQWSYSLPTTHRPLFDTAACEAGQSGKVWFLGGTFRLFQQGGDVVGVAERTCDVPAVRPLSHGSHTLHFTGGIPGFRLDITYHLNIG